MERLNCTNQVRIIDDARVLFSKRASTVFDIRNTSAVLVWSKTSQLKHALRTEKNKRRKTIATLQAILLVDGQ
jgi:hypothetical protein